MTGDDSDDGELEELHERIEESLAEVALRPAPPQRCEMRAKVPVAIPVTGTLCTEALAGNDEGDAMRVAVFQPDDALDAVVPDCAASVALGLRALPALRECVALRESEDRRAGVALVDLSEALWLPPTLDAHDWHLP